MPDEDDDETADPLPSGTPLLDLLDLGRDPDRLAVVDATRSVTRHGLATAARMLAAQVFAHIRPGHRLALVPTDSLDDVVVVVAAVMAGRSVAMLPILDLASPDLPEALRQADCDAYAHAGILHPVDPVGHGTDLPPDTRPPATRPGDQEAALLFTSGTTSHAQGVRLSTAGVTANVAAMLQVTVPPSDTDRLGLVLGLTHSFGLSMLLLSLTRGVPVVMLGTGAASRGLVEAMVHHKVTTLACVPYFLRLAARRHLDLTAGGRLDTLFLAGGGIEDGELDDLLPHPVATTYLMYGFTEASARCAVRRRGDGAPRDSVGRPLPGVRIEIVDEAGAVVPNGVEGRIRVWSPALMIGYLDEPPRDPAQPFTTTDLGRVDDHGHLFITGRTVEMHNFRGNRVSLRAVENRIGQVPGVLAALLQPESAAEDAVCRLLLVAAPASDPATVRRAALAQVEPRGLVSQVQLVDDLPRTRTGKLLRRPADGAPPMAAQEGPPAGTGPQPPSGSSRGNVVMRYSA